MRFDIANLSCGVVGGEAHGEGKETGTGRQGSFMDLVRFNHMKLLIFDICLDPLVSRQPCPVIDRSSHEAFALVVAGNMESDEVMHGVSCGKETCVVGHPSLCGHHDSQQTKNTEVQ